MQSFQKDFPVSETHRIQEAWLAFPLARHYLGRVGLPGGMLYSAHLECLSIGLKVLRKFNFMYISFAFVPQVMNDLPIRGGHKSHEA